VTNRGARGHSPAWESFTITFSGQTTAAIGATTSATAAQVQSAQEPLSNLAPGDVSLERLSAKDSRH
jgi:hypothetical protein